MSYDGIVFKDTEGGYAVFKGKGFDGSRLNIPPEHEGKPVVEICEYGFENCYNLRSVTIPSTVKRIDRKAFNRCRGLTRITIPMNVTVIEDEAFLECIRLVEVRNLSSLDIQCKSESYGYVSNYAKNVYRDYEGGGKFTETDDGFVFYSYTSENGIVEHLLIGYIGNDPNLILPERCDGALYSVNDYAFYDSRIETIDIPSTVTNIGKSAFCEINSIKKVYVSDLDSWRRIKFANDRSSPLCGGDASLYANGVLVMNP